WLWRGLRQLEDAVIERQHKLRVAERHLIAAGLGHHHVQLEVVWPRGRERDASQHRLQLAEEVSGHGEGAAACLIAASDCYLLTRVVDERRNRLLACNEDQLGRGYGLRGAALRSARQRQREDGIIELSGRSCRRELRAEGNLASVRRQRDS